MPVRAVLFDLDGTLVDSERESAEAMARVFVKDTGIELTHEQKMYVVGHSWNEIYPQLQRDFGQRVVWSKDELIARTAHERVGVIAERGLTVLPGAREAVVRFGSRWPIALVTGSGREEAAQALAIVNAGREFDLIVASEDVTHGKPSPEPYLQAARRLGVPPAACVCFEDSLAGITSGCAAGMRVIAIRAGNFLQVDQGQAHKIVDTLDDITIELLEELPEAAA